MTTATVTATAAKDVMTLREFAQVITGLGIKLSSRGRHGWVAERVVHLAKPNGIVETFYLEGSAASPSQAVENLLRGNGHG